MSYFDAHCKTESELHTVGALLCVLEMAAFDHLTQDDAPIASGIINLIQVVAERVEKVQELLEAEYDVCRPPRTSESPIAILHREIVKRRAFLSSDHGLSEEAFDAYNMETVKLADQILDLPARNPDDMLRKIMGYTINGDHDLSEGEAAERIFAEARALVNMQEAGAQ